MLYACYCWHNETGYSPICPCDGIKSDITKYINTVIINGCCISWDSFKPEIMKTKIMPLLVKLVSATLMSPFIRWLSGVESYHHLQQRHRHYGGGAAGRTASIQGTLFLASQCESKVDFVTKQILRFTACISQSIIAAVKREQFDTTDCWFASLPSSEGLAYDWAAGLLGEIFRMIWIYQFYSDWLCFKTSLRARAAAILIKAWFRGDRSMTGGL